MDKRRIFVGRQAESVDMPLFPTIEIERCVARRYLGVDDSEVSAAMLLKPTTSSFSHATVPSNAAPVSRGIRCTQ